MLGTVDKTSTAVKATHGRCHLSFIESCNNKCIIKVFPNPKHNLTRKEKILPRDFLFKCTHWKSMLRMSPAHRLKQPEKEEKRKCLNLFVSFVIDHYGCPGLPGFIQLRI